MSKDDLKPLVELSTKGHATKYRGLTMGQLEKAQRLHDEGATSAAEIERMYPGWESASAELKAGFASMAEAARVGVGTALSDVLKHLDISRGLMSNTLRQAGEAAVRINMPQLGPILPAIPDLGALELRDPDAATREVADEVRELRALVAALAESARINAEVARASLDQAAALVSTVGSLHETTRQGISAGEARDAAATKRENILVRLTWVVVALTAVLAIPEIRHTWSDAEPWRASLGEWIQSLRRP